MTIRIDFDWDPEKAASNAGKHRVAFEEAVAVFRDPFARSIVDPDHPPGEERWITIGESSTGNLLESYPVRLNRRAGLTFCLRMIFSENRCPLFGIMR